MISSNFKRYCIECTKKITLDLNDGQEIILDQVKSYQINDSNSDAYVDISNALYIDGLYNAMKKHKHVNHLHIENVIVDVNNTTNRTTSHIDFDCDLKINNCTFGMDEDGFDDFAVELKGEIFN